ncbi:MAG: BON domain-containing protein [Polaromonas sp.]|nr:BON domain-containing protein [Polaromonas sp.]
MKFASMNRLVCALGAAILLGSSLSACVGPLLVGGAVVGGGMVVADRRTSGTQLEDEGIELRGASQIRANLGTRVRVNLASYNRKVLMTGEVPSLKDKEWVEQLVSQVENVNSVVNELEVLDSPSFAVRSSDVLLSGHVKAMLIDAADLKLNAFKLVTERGTVYLMGRVTQREADRATEVVRATPGVQKVVRVLEIISEDELARLRSSL